MYSCRHVLWKKAMKKGLKVVSRGAHEPRYFPRRIKDVPIKRTKHEYIEILIT